MNISPFRKRNLSNECADYLQRIISGGSSIGPVAINAIDTFVKACKVDGTWDLLQDVGPVCGNDLTAALVKLKSQVAGTKSYIPTGFVASDYSQATGIKFNGSQNLRTGVLGTSFTYGSTSIGVYDRSSPTGVTQIHGITSDPDRLVLYSTHADTKPYSNMYNVAGELQGSSFAGPIGMVMSSRVSTPSNAHTIYRNGSSVASSASAPAGSLLAFDFVWGGVNSAGTPTVLSTHFFSFFCLGLGFTSAQASLFNTRVQALQTALGRNV